MPAFWEWERIVRIVQLVKVDNRIVVGLFFRSDIVGKGSNNGKRKGKLIECILKLLQSFL